MRRVLGIDAGGTKTVALLADERGHVLAETRGGGANLQTHGELQVEKVFHELIEGLDAHGRADAVCLGIAGVDRPRDRELVAGILRRLGHRERALIVNDALIALVAGAEERVGIVVLAGTGSIAYGRDRNGRVARAGGYGFLLADEGSGYWLGHEALRAAVRDDDGRGPATAIKALVFERLGVASVPELVPLAYEQGLAKYQIAALADVVEAAGGAGDAVAREILGRAGAELALAARSVAARLAFSGAFPVLLAGGVFKACPSLVERVSASLGLERARVRRLEVEPAQGAVSLALELLRQEEKAR
jgi:N-acetylglucosamine kinase-like BadF-type ATPase